MTQQEFLISLESDLKKGDFHSPQKIREILSDYEEHFTHGKSKGKTEQEIASALGSPSSIAKAYQTESLLREVKNPEGFRWGLALQVLGRLLIIAPFNFLFLTIPGVLIFTMLAMGWAFALAIGSAGLAAFSLITLIATLSLNAWAWIAAISMGLGLIGLSCIGVIVMFVVSKYIVLALIGYLQWNLKFVLDRGDQKT
jgi:uncharacterized membrane protein